VRRRTAGLVTLNSRRSRALFATGWSFTVLQFELPWLWLLLPLPLLIWLFAPAYKQVRPALRLPMFGRLVEGLNQEASSGATVAHPHRLQRLLRVLLWGLLVAAVARPV